MNLFPSAMLCSINSTPPSDRLGMKSPLPRRIGQDERKRNRLSSGGQEALWHSLIDGTRRTILDSMSRLGSRGAAGGQRRFRLDKRPTTLAIQFGCIVGKQEVGNPIRKVVAETRGCRPLAAFAAAINFVNGREPHLN